MPLILLVIFGFQSAFAANLSGCVYSGSDPVFEVYEEAQDLGTPAESRTLQITFAMKKASELPVEDFINNLRVSPGDTQILLNWFRGLKMNPMSFIRLDEIGFMFDKSVSNKWIFYFSEFISFHPQTGFTYQHRGTIEIDKQVFQTARRQFEARIKSSGGLGASCI